MKIADGTPEAHETPLPVDTAHSPAVAGLTPVFAAGNVQGAVLGDISGMDFTAEAAAAMHAGMAADADRRGRYAAAMSPMGASATDEMSLPPVPEQVTAPASGNLYGQGNQPGA